MSEDSLLAMFLITIDGRIPENIMLQSIEQMTVETSLHLPSVATIILHDPELAWLDDSMLEPGRELRITSVENKILFDGEIVEVEGDLDVQGQRVIVRAFDRLHRLARGTHSRTFKQVDDGGIVRMCAGEAGLTVQADATSEQHAYYMQVNESDLSLLQRRAAAHGFLLYVDQKKLCFKKPATTATVTLDFGSTLNTFRPRISAIGYLDKTTVRGWNPQRKEAVVGESGRSELLPTTALPYKDYLGLQPALRIANLAVQSQNEAKQVAQASTDAQNSRFIEAEGVCMGTIALKAGVSVQVQGVGTRFSGTYFVTNAIHRILPGDSYTTEFSVSGLNPTSILGMLAPPTSEHQPLGNLTIGVVTDNRDPDNLGRVKVKFPLIIEDKSNQELVTDWVRIGALGAGATRGVLFLPEVNDEVLIGFGQGDINIPFVLGTLWNGKDKIPGTPSKLVAGGKVEQRVLYSRTGHYILLDDSDSDGGISLIDKKGNKIVLKAQDNSLTIETAGDITLTTKGNLSMDVTGNGTIKTKGNLSLEASGNLSLKATGNLNAEALSQASIKGTGGANLESSAVVNVKGSLINLN